MRQQVIGRARSVGHLLSPLIVVSILILVFTACSDHSLADLGGRSSDWIGEVATTASSTTTTAPVLLQSATAAEWINDEFGGPDPDVAAGAVLAEVFARSGDASRFLQASREEIVAVVDEARFPSRIPVEVSHITSQLVIESRELTLADDPTVAFGFWTVPPYTRSRSVGQMGVLNLSRDPTGVERAGDGSADAVCTALVPPEVMCGPEDLGSMVVWRVEDGQITHTWYADPFRYELRGFTSIDEDLVHEVITSLVPLSELVGEEASEDSG